jgi:ERCC4-related helicase
MTSPINLKPRKYQEEIFKTCKDKNCLVVLPTGLGKTLIGLMLAVERIEKFPLEKILFLAPTKPLAEQHLISFKKNLPELWADIELFTGQVKAEKRKKIWDTANIIFSTPQCIANDLKNGLYNLEEVSLLVEDEAHRCVKNYDYTYIAKVYLAQSKNPRLVGLTASPGSDTKKNKRDCKKLIS